MGANNQVKTVKMNKAYFLPDMLTCENEEEEEEDPHACGSETQSSTTNDDEDHENHDRGEEEEDSRNNNESREEEGGDNAIDTGDNASDSDTELATKEVHHDHGVHAPRAPKATKSDYAVGVASTTILEETTLADALGHCNGVCNTTTTTTTTAEATMGATNSTTVTDLFQSHEDVSSQEEENDKDKAPPIANMSAANSPQLTETFQSHENLSSQDQQEEQQEQQEQEQEEAPPPPTPQPPTMIEERGELSSLYVGRIIGKGGEMIRDLQARSGCHIDVDQNVPVGEPRIIVYRGESVVDVEFAKRLVDMLCTSKKEAETAAAEEAAYRATTTAATADFDGHYGGSCGQHSHGHGHPAHHHHLRIELPLGKATLRRIQVPKALIGKIIGRGGEMIRELQSKSHARIQVDHAGEYTTTTTTNMGGSSSVVDGGEHVHTRQVTVTGTEESVEKAVDMIGYLMTSNSNRGVGGEQRHLQHHQNNWSWDSSDDNVVGPSSLSSQQGQHPHGVQTLLAGAAAMGNDPYWIAAGAYSSPGQKQSSDAVIGMGYHDSSMGYTHPHHPQGSWNATANQTNVANSAATTAIEQPMTMMIESDIVPCAKKDVGHIIGRKGATINDLQRRSSCNIQIDQKKYVISITGYRHGIEMAKLMLQQIVERGCTHPYAGGHKQAFDIGSEEQQQREQQQREPSYLYQHQHQQNVTVQQQQQPPHSPLGYADHQHQQQGYHQTQDGYLNQHHDQYNQQHHYEGMVQTNQNMQEFYGGQHPMPMMMMYQQPPQQQQQHQQQYPAAAAGTQTAALSDSPWIAASTMDGRIYYYNQNTMETRWEGPQGME